MAKRLDRYSYLPVRPGFLVNLVYKKFYIRILNFSKGEFKEIEKRNVNKFRPE